MRPTTACDVTNVFDLSALFHPGAVYEHPNDVVADSQLTIGEKRAILASWASDSCAVASCPELRAPENLRRPVSVDEIFDALRQLDNEPAEPPGGKPMRLRSVDRLMVAA